VKLTDKFEKCPGIYIFTNLVNGKVYVGETMNMKRRMKEHRGKSSDQVISRAIRKYGSGNFNLYIEYLPNFEKKDLLKFEEELITKFNCLVPNGYNVCESGRDCTGTTLTQEAKDKISKANKGKVRSKEQRMRISQSKTGIPIHSEESRKKLSEAGSKRRHTEESKQKISKGNMGKKMSFEARVKLSKAKKGQKLTEATKLKISKRLLLKKPTAISVAQIEPETLKVVSVWPCIRDASEFLTGRRKSTDICACLRGKQKTAYGFKWEYC
jgi:group I intron endonuclease